MALAGCSATVENPTNPAFVFPPAPDPARYVYEQTITGSKDVVRTELSQIRQLITGEERIANVKFQKPYGVAVHKGVIYVSDSGQGRVWVLDFPRGRFRELGAGLVYKPLGIDVDEQGNVYVCDSAAGAVYVFDRNGKVIRKIGHRDLFDRPAGVAVDPAGEKVFIVDVGGVNSDRHRVRVFDAESAEHLYDIGGRGREPGLFNLPRDARIGKDGLLYVVDGGNFRVQVFEQDGTLVRVFGSVGRQSGQFARPKGVALDQSGRIYVSDAAFGNFQVFTREGQLLLSVGTRSNANEPAKFMLPAGVFADEDGRIYMVDQFFRKIDVFRPVALGSRQGYLARRSGDRELASDVPDR